MCGGTGRRSVFPQCFFLQAALPFPVLAPLSSCALLLSFDPCLVPHYARTPTRARSARTAGIWTVALLPSKAKMAMPDQLPLEAVVGFAGSIPGGLVLHPNGKTMAYPLGATIVVKELGDSYSQSFLQGHTDEVSCLAISRDGSLLASGQITNMGFSADIIVWDLHAREVVHRMSLHKVKVQELSFSHDGLYLASLGGQDDNSLVIWDVNSGNAVCGTPTPGLTKCVRFLNTNSDQVVTGGGNTLVVWDFDLANRKLRPTPCRLGNIRRDTNYITIDERVSRFGTAPVGEQGQHAPASHGPRGGIPPFPHRGILLVLELGQGKRTVFFPAHVLVRLVRCKDQSIVSDPACNSFQNTFVKTFSNVFKHRTSTCTSVPPQATCFR